MQFARCILSTASLVCAVSLSAQPPPTNPGRGGGGRAGFGMGLISRDVPDAAAVERGQKSFVGTCGFCHGTNANGGESGPDLIRSPLALNDENGDKIGPVIRQGRPANGMPAFPQMTDEQVHDVAAFIRSRQQAAINRGKYTIQELNTGDAKKGQAYFTAHCANCHSAAKDLAGIAAKYQPDVLIARILYPARRGARSSVSVTGPAGQSYSGTLEYLDDFEVALRDASGVYRSFARTRSLKVEVTDPLASHVDLLKKYTDAELHNVLAYLETLK